MHSARVTIRMDDPRWAGVVASALSPDGTSDDPRSRFEIVESRGGLIVEVRSEDLSSLRACLNTLLRSCDVAVESLRVTKGSGSK
jgi:tRNA threonylcarbamoyladenosine modification (KEOPS) complex  Pcc1 subunit